MNRSILFFSANFLLAIGPLSNIQALNPKALPSDLPSIFTVADLADLVNERLSYMKDVAAYKWQNQLPIEDLERERIVIRNSIEQAAAFGLDSASTQSFFEEQITAAKLIQQYWFDQWKERGFDDQLSFRDLNTEVRPALLELGNQILGTISALKLWEKSESFISKVRIDFITSLTSEGLGFKEKRILFEAVIQIKGLKDEEPIFQVSRLDSLSIGMYEGKTTYGALKSYGDFGLGTFNYVDGEMVAIDGQFYQIKTDGQASPVKKSLKTPFAVVTHFDKDLEFTIEQSMSLSKFLDFLSSKLESLDGYYAIRFDGTFELAKTRSVHPQEKPFPPLSEVIAGQVIFELKEVQGTMAGYYLPEEVEGENAKGYHFHFLTADRKTGGHFLDGIIKNGVVSIDVCSGLKNIKEASVLSKR